MYKEIKNNIAQISLILSFLISSFSHAQNQIVNPARYWKVKDASELKIKSQVNKVLKKYCADLCELLEVSSNIEESVDEESDLGFEGVIDDKKINYQAFIKSVSINIQIDDRVSQLNRTRLQQVIQNHLKKIKAEKFISFTPIVAPQIANGTANNSIKNNLKLKIEKKVNKIITKYCNESCILSMVDVKGSVFSAEKARITSQTEPETKLIWSKTGSEALKIDSVDIEIAIDKNISSVDSDKISNLIKAKTRFVSPLDVQMVMTSFPDSIYQRKKREIEAKNDPFGLNKLRKTLEIFKELAGTKEIISKTITENNKTLQTKVDKNTIENSRSTLSASEKVNSTENSKSIENSKSTESSKSLSEALEKQSGQEPLDLKMWAIVGAGLFVFIILFALVLKFSSANKDAKAMVSSFEQPHSGSASQKGSNNQESNGNSLYVSTALDPEARKEFEFKMRSKELKDELVQIFMDAPKVAKATFTRLLEDGGVEETAKYIHVFGHLVVFELLDDPHLKRDLFELTEYYHRSNFSFDIQEEYELLKKLKTKVTASEIKVMSNKQSGHFDFLSNLDQSQIFALIQNEKYQIQSIILTQLDNKRRRGVFDFYRGDAKIKLMQELCSAEVIPKDYLINVAHALRKKATSSPEFDTENLRTSEIIFDLLEKSTMEEQKSLMSNLMQTAPDSARAIKLKLITLDTLMYLKDGHLLEMVFSLDREELISFLAGAPQHIQNLLISKAPEELADSWIEDLANVTSVNDETYALSKLRLVGKVRALANKGVINIVDINDMIFGKMEDRAVEEEEGNGIDISSDAGMVA